MRAPLPFCRPFLGVVVTLSCLAVAACSDASKGRGATAGASGGAGLGAAGATGAAGAATAGAAGAGTGTAGASAGAAGGATAGPAGASAGAAGGATAGTGGGTADDGGAGGAAGTSVVDAGGVGGFGFSGGSRCAGSDLRLCESFENGLDATLWQTLADADGTAVIDDTRAFRGTHSLHVKVVNQGHKAAISETKTFPIANNVLYARMFVWFDTFTTMAHFTMMEAPQTAAGAWIRFGGQFGSYGVGTDHGASGDWLEHDTTPVPTKQWTCLEIELDGTTNTFHVWQDEVERTALDVGAVKHNGFVMPAFTSLWFGWQTYSNQAPGEFWVDEIAVDGKRIGCAN